MTKPKAIALSILGILAATWLTLHLTGVTDRLPPRSAVKVARVVSGLGIPKNAEVLKFTDKWNTFGEGFVEIELSLARQDLDRLREEALHRGYLPVRQEDAERVAFDPAAPAGPDALYSLRGRLDSGDYELAVLDLSRRRLGVRVLAN